MSAHPDVIVDRYRVLEEAGRGGMGSVYRCVDERLGREVAVKQVGKLPGESVTDQARALREARSSAGLNHPHVVSVYDAVAEGDHVWLVMEYVEGRTLSQLMREEGPLEPARVARIGAQVAEGLAAAHERGTVHRDVKPGNVLVSGEDRAKISDFGIARTEGDANLTQSGMLSGTPAYIAPEVARGGRPEPASDVWALGATLFAAVEGEPPYGTGPNAMGLLTAIATEEPPVPERAGPLTGPIQRMLDRDPGSRWSMTDVAHALRRVHTRETPSEDTREQTRSGSFAPTPPPPTTTPTPEPTPEPTPTPTPAPPPATSRPRRRLLPLLLLLVVVLAVAIGVLALLPGESEQTPTADEPTSDSASPSPDRSSGTDDAGSTGSAAPATGQVGFVEDYYAALPEDTEAGYARLSPAYQEQTSYADYDGFWSTIGEVEVLEATRSGPDAVDVTLRYDGSEEEVRRIYLERDGGDWLIADDEVVG